MAKKIFLLLIVILTISSTTEVNAQFWKRKKNKTKADTTKVKKETPYEKLLKNPSKEVKGLINMYEVKGKLYLEVPLDLMGKDMLLASTISQISDNNHGVVGSKPFNPWQVEFTQVDSSLQLRRITKNLIAPETDKNILNALDKNSIGAIVENFKIKAFNPDRSAAVIDVTNFFLKDIKELSPLGAGLRGYERTESFKKDRSFIGELKSFEDNLTIKSHMSYEYTLKKGKRTYAKNRAFTAVMTRTLLLLPEQAADPRIADPRIGIFVSRKNKLSNTENRSKAVYYAHKFNLVPKDIDAFNRGELVEPVKPIIFYVDNDFPESWRGSVKNAINDWQEVFEKIGFKNAISAIDYPTDDPEFDPDNLKYNCVRYAPAPIANAMGPSWVDPRSGEIINASVYVWHNIVKLLNNWMFIQISPADKNVRSINLPEQYLKDGLRYVLRHEVGHCLGFMHNMSSSAMIPVDSLRSPSFTQKYGTTYSIMDYARFNYVAQPGDKEKGVRLSPPKFGLYDYFLVKWNYSYFPQCTNPEEESVLLTAMISEKADDPIYRYGKQQGAIFDPSSQMEDLGDDAVKASVYGIKNLKYVMNHLNEWVGTEDKDYAYRQTIWNGIISQYVRYINHIYANVGGIYVNEKYEGDPRPFFESVPRQKQEESLTFLLKEIKNLDWLEKKEVIENMALTGTPASYLRSKLVDALLSSSLKVNLSALKSTEANPYTPKECMDDIYASVWENTIKGKAINSAEKDIQKAFVKSIIKGSDLASAEEGGKKSIAANYLQGIQAPEFVKQKNIEDFGYQGYNDYMNPNTSMNVANPVAGFPFGTTVSFNLMPSLENLYYRVLLDTKTLLKKRLKSCRDEETKLHYQLLVHQIEKTLK